MQKTIEEQLVERMPPEERLQYQLKKSGLRHPDLPNADTSPGPQTQKPHKSGDKNDGGNTRPKRARRNKMENQGTENNGQKEQKAEQKKAAPKGVPVDGEINVKPIEYPALAGRAAVVTGIAVGGLLLKEGITALVKMKFGGGKKADAKKI